MDKNFSTLELSPSADWQSVRSAYLRLIRQCHPDRYMGNELLRKLAEEQTKQINVAFYALHRHFLECEAQSIDTGYEPAPNFDGLRADCGKQPEVEITPSEQHGYDTAHRKDAPDRKLSQFSRFKKRVRVAKPSHILDVFIGSSWLKPVLIPTIIALSALALLPGLYVFFNGFFFNPTRQGDEQTIKPVRKLVETNTVMPPKRWSSDLKPAKRSFSNNDPPASTVTNPVDTERRDMTLTHADKPELIRSVILCRPNEVADLLKKGADVNVRDSVGDTPLIWAAKSNCISAVKILLAHDANVPDRSRNGYNALDWATSYRRHELVDVLQKKKANLGDEG